MNWPNVCFNLAILILISTIVTFILPGPEFFIPRNGLAILGGFFIGLFGPSIFEEKE